MKRIIKIIKKILRKTILLLLIAAVVVPPAAFAWRIFQPMNMPVYKGLSYAQFTAWRWRHWQQGTADIPDRDARFCAVGELGLEWVGFTFSSTLGTGLALFKGEDWMREHFPKDTRTGFYPAVVTWKTILPVWWDTWEHEIDYVSLNAADKPPTPTGCRYSTAEIPTPEEYEQLRAEREAERKSVP